VLCVERSPTRDDPGTVPGLEEGLRGGKQSPQLKAVKDEGLDEAALELNGSNRRISCDK